MLALAPHSSSTTPRLLSQISCLRSASASAPLLAGAAVSPLSSSVSLMEVSAVRACSVLLEWPVSRVLWRCRYRELPKELRIEVRNDRDRGLLLLNAENNTVRNLKS